MKYWKTSDQVLIKNNLEKLLEEKIEFTVWQQLGTHRKTYKGKVVSLDERSAKILLDKEALKNNGPVEDGSPFFVHVDSMEMIFKRDKFDNFGDVLDFYLPTQVQMYEKRKTERFTYKYQDHKNITFHSIEMHPVKGTPEFIVSSILTDISTAGCSMVIDSRTIEKLETGDYINIVHLTDQQFKNAIKTQIVYITPYNKYEGPGLFRVGMIFNDELDAIDYKSINSVVSRKQKKCMGLRQDRYCGLDDAERDRILANIAVKNHVLSDNIKENLEYIDRLRYMTKQMKIEFLRDVNLELLASALRMSSKELIYDLFIDVPEGLVSDFLEKLEVERTASTLCTNQEELIKFMRKKEGKGEIILDPLSFDEFV